MIKKDYHSLNDLPKRFDINLPSIKKLIDEKKITPLFYQTATKVVIGGIDKDRRFVGYGVAEYNGMVTIQRSQFSKLWDENETHANFIILESHIGISNYSEVNPFTAPFPSGLIWAWQATPLEELKRNRLIAICLPKIKIDYFSYSIDTNQNVYSSETLNEHELEKLLQPEYQCLSEEMLHLKNVEIFISNADLIQAGVIKSELPMSDYYNTDLYQQKWTLH